MKGDFSSVKVNVEDGPVYRPTVVTLVREKSTHRWKLGGALLVLALCVAAAICFTWHTEKQDHTEETNEIQHTLRQLSGTEKAAIHLEGEYNPDGEYRTSVEWSDDVNPAFKQGGLQLENNEVVIPKSGLYFVYSQVSFRFSCLADGKSESELVHISHMVKRWARSTSPISSSDYKPLLHSVRTVCKLSSAGKSGEKWYSAMYMGAVFSLDEGDRLKTVTENRLLPELDNSTGKNVFGVFAL
ncbi:hypothetical protein DPEC_G00287800 [Dallia pectoralis]|uniref:Uncharacterized protein n=1 Tax=Dallia pectoralis TaxID=75939 RepID=A0ACC2FKJ1_DALPE|nr:hypothetical protein DPEC_G00287800 [Dallia pectoralis]